MELLEYQAKELFRTVGIPILPSQTIKDARKIKQLQIPYPVVLKSQVRSGGRGKAGGVRFVANTIDAIAAARSIFNLSILGEYPEVILAEAHYNAKRELFLAIVLDYELKCPVLLGSPWGGMNVGSLLDSLQAVPVEGAFSAFHSRRLASNMGLNGDLLCSVSDIVTRMYRLFWEKDLDLIEINPLGVNAKGELMALDGKITINDYALSRQPIVKTLGDVQWQSGFQEVPSKSANQDDQQMDWRYLDWQHKTGKTAMICNSFDAALLTWDLLKQYKIAPVTSILLEGRLPSGEVGDYSDALTLYQAKLLEILAELELKKGIKVVVLNIWETEAISREIISVIADYCNRTSQPAEVGSLSEPNVPQHKAIEDEAVAIQSRDTDSPQVTEQIKKTLRLPCFILRLLNTVCLDDLMLPERIYLSDNLEVAVEYASQVVKATN